MGGDGGLPSSGRNLRLRCSTGNAWWVGSKATWKVPYCNQIESIGDEEKIGYTSHGEQEGVSPPSGAIRALEGDGRVSWR